MKKDDVFIGTSLTPAEYKKFKAMADANGRSVRGQMRYLAHQALAAAKAKGKKVVAA